MHNFLNGLIIGILTVAPPIGPIAVLCIRRSLTQGFSAGFATGLGAAIADGIYGLIASIGLTAISNILFKYQLAFKLLGGSILIIIGLRIFLTKNLPNTIATTSKSFIATMIETFFITLANPFIILYFTSIGGLLGFGNEVNNYNQALSMGFGIFIGSMLWFFLLSLILSFNAGRFSINTINRINKISGILLIIFGLIIVFGFRL